MITLLNPCAAPGALIRTWAVHALVALGLGCASVKAEGTPIQAIGVNISNPQWSSREEQDRVLAEMHAAGVKFARYPFEASAGEGVGRDFGPIVDFTKRAFRLGIRANLIIPIQWQPGAQPRAAIKGTIASWPQPGLSQADADLMQKTMRPLIAQLEDAGVVLASIEVGNEINWPQFNGDFVVPGRGKRYTLDELERDPEGRKVAAGYRVYLQSLAAIKTIRDESRLNKATPIISAGLADVSPLGPKPEEKIDSVEIGTSLAYLRGHGLDKLADIYGVHTYAGQTEPLRSNMGRAEGYLGRYVLSECKPGGEGKPCWITEWGLLMPSLSCPANDHDRAKIAGAFLGALRPFWRSGSVTGLMYYDWSDAAKPFGLYACSSMTETGKKVLSGP